MIFYLTFPDYLALERTDVPLFVNHYALFGGRSKRLPRAKGAWCLDSGGYTQLHKKENNGRWPFSPEQYVHDVRRCVEEIGKLQWAATMDWMVEDSVLAKTGLDVREHQYRTIDSYLELRRLGGPAMEHLWLPVLQGKCPEDYFRHVQMYMNEGVALEQADWVGVGSVCRLGKEDQIASVFGQLSSMGLYRLHAFGLKSTGLTWRDVETRPRDPHGLRLAQLYRTARERGHSLAEVEERLQVENTTWEQVGTSVCNLIYSADSNAWSLRARKHGTGVWAARNEAFGYNQWVAYQGALWRYAGRAPAPGSNVSRLRASGLSVRRRGGRVTQKNEPALGEHLGAIHHDRAGGSEKDPFTPTQMLAECSIEQEAKDRGEIPEAHERCNSDLRWALAWRERLRSTLSPQGCWHETPYHRRLPPPPHYPPERRAYDLAVRLRELGVDWPAPQQELFNPASAL